MLLVDGWQDLQLIPVKTEVQLRELRKEFKNKISPQNLSCNCRIKVDIV